MGNSLNKSKRHENERLERSIRNLEVSYTNGIDKVETLSVASSSCSEDVDHLLQGAPSNHVVVNENNGYVFSKNTFVCCERENLIVQLGRWFPNLPYSRDSIENHPVLRELKSNLQLLYRGEESWLVPLPWKEENMYELEEYFIHMDMDELDKKGTKIIRAKIAIDNILESIDNKNCFAPRRILLQAEPGYGKSTTTTRVALDWATKPDSNFGKFALIILIRLRDLDCSLEDWVSQFAIQKCKQTITEDEMRPLLSGLEEKLLLILDGMDECPESHFKSVERIIKLDKKGAKQSYLIGSTILMTTRPSLSSKMCFFTERHIRIRGMSVIERELFIRRYFSSQEEANSVLRVLKRKTFQWDMSPLVLFLICNLVKEEQIPSLQEESKLFYLMFKFLGKRYVTKECLDWTEEEIMENIIAVGELCFNLLKYNVLIFKKNELKNLCSCPEHFVIGCGIFRKLLSRRSIHKTEECYEPVHAKFMEHLAVLYLQTQCDRMKTLKLKFVFLKSVINRIHQQFSTVSVYDFEEDNEIRFRTCVLPGTIDVLFTKRSEKPESYLEIIILPHTDMVSRLQPSTDFSGSVSLKIAVYLTLSPSHILSMPQCIPTEYREVISHFIDEYGRIMCRFTIHRSCACTLSKFLFDESSINHIKELVSFDFNDENKICRECSFSQNRDITKMFRRVEKRAKQFSIRRTPSKICDTVELLSKLRKPNYFQRKLFTTNLTFLGDINGAAKILAYAVTISGLPTRCYDSAETDSVGRFLLWILTVFGYSKRVSTVFFSDIERRQSLRIHFAGLKYNFTTNDSGKKSYSLGDNTESISSTTMKKLIRTWNNSDINSEHTSFDVNFSCSVKLLSCEVIVLTNNCQGGCSCGNRFTMDKFEI